MSFSEFLKQLRFRLDHWWIIIVFGLIYFISQIIIGILLETIGSSDVAKLQVLGFDKIYYINQFQEWKNKGLLEIYKAHFTFDDIHFLWYAIALTACLSKSMNLGQLNSRYNPVLLLPIIAGLLDSFENSIQHIFLSSEDFSTIIDPLPMLSTYASIFKWILVAISIFCIINLSIKYFLKTKNRKLG